MLGSRQLLRGWRHGRGIALSLRHMLRPTHAWPRDFAMFVPTCNLGGKSLTVTQCSGAKPKAQSDCQRVSGARQSTEPPAFAPPHSTREKVLRNPLPNP